MRVDQDGDHAVGLVRLDEAHAAHVCGEVEDIGGTGDGAATGVALAEVGGHVLHAGMALVPALLRLDVHSTDRLEPTLLQLSDEVASDEPARTSHDDQPVPAHALSHGPPSYARSIGDATLIVAMFVAVTGWMMRQLVLNQGSAASAL
jgi:hypothetical protein